MALQCSGKFEEAEHHCVRAIELDPRNLWAYCAMGGMLSRERQYRKAEEAYRTALQCARSDGLCWEEGFVRVALGDTLRAQGRSEEAMGEYIAANRVSPRDPATYAKLGSHLRRCGLVDEAVEKLEEAVRLSPSHRRYESLAKALIAQGNLDEAWAALDRALELADDSPGNYNLRAQILVEQGKHAEAVEAYCSAVALDPSRTWIHRGLAVALLQCDTSLRSAALDKYLDDMEGAATVSSPAVLSAVALALVHADKARNPTKASGYAERALALTDRRDPTALAALGKTLFVQHRYTDAVHALEKAAAMPDAGAIHEKLLEEYQRQVPENRAEGRKDGE
jgi:tetratricopeptide (TPR) repeat protein